MTPNYDVETPDYKGPNRREHCDCHIKHDKILQDHDTELKDLRKERREREERSARQHEGLWDGVKSKTEKKLFYIFVLIVVGILGVTYQGIHNLALDLKDVEKQVAINNVQGKEIAKALERIDGRIEKTNTKLENHMLNTQNGDTAHALP
jgi:hypothetical protein